MPMLLVRPTVLPAESQWTNTRALDIGVFSESFTAPFSSSPNVIAGVMTASLRLPEFYRNIREVRSMPSTVNGARSGGAK